MESDIIFYVPMVRLADLISKWMEQVYLLSFEYVSQNLTGPLWQGKKRENQSKQTSTEIQRLNLIKPIKCNACI